MPYTDPNQTANHVDPFASLRAQVETLRTQLESITSYVARQSDPNEIEIHTAKASSIRQQLEQVETELRLKEEHERILREGRNAV